MERLSIASIDQLIVKSLGNSENMFHLYAIFVAATMNHLIISEALVRFGLASL